MESKGSSGVISVRVNYTVEATLLRVRALLETRGIALFAVIDHSGEAARVGFSMRPTKLLIFGNPKTGTPLMLAAPGSAIDLPMKLLVWEDDSGATFISYNNPQYLQERHHIPAELTKSLGISATLVEQAGD